MDQTAVLPVGSVYQIQEIDSPSGPRYIGSTYQTLETRMIEHMCEARTGNAYKLYGYMRTYGIDQFEITLLESVVDITLDDLVKLEQSYIDKFNSVKEGLNGKNATLTCLHGKDRRRCSPCGGCHMCEHGRQAYGCKDCRKAGFCEHGRCPTRCKDCRGSGRCHHGPDGVGPRREACWQCNPCHACKDEKIKSPALPKHLKTAKHLKNVARLAQLQVDAVE